MLGAAAASGLSNVADSLHKPNIYIPMAATGLIPLQSCPTGRLVEMAKSHL